MEATPGAPPTSTARDEPDRPGEPLNLKQVARELGVHYMTAYRYVRHGRLPAHRDGAVWLVAPRDLERFRAGSAAGPAPVGERGAVTRARVNWARRLHAPLLAGDETRAWALLNDALAWGHDLSSVHLDVLVPALAAVGDDRDAGRIGAAQERIAVATATRLVARLGGRAPRPGRRKGTVLLALPPGEHHGLPLAVVANLVRHAGYRVVELGTDTPPDEVVDALDAAPDLVAVGLGATTVDRLDDARRVIEAVRAARPGLPVLLGGRAVRNPEVAELLGATAWSGGADVAEVLAAATAAARRSRRAQAGQKSSSKATEPVTPT